MRPAGLWQPKHLEYNQLYAQFRILFVFWACCFYNNCQQWEIFDILPLANFIISTPTNLKMLTCHLARDLAVSFSDNKSIMKSGPNFVFWNIVFDITMHAALCLTLSNSNKYQNTSHQISSWYALYSDTQFAFFWRLNTRDPVATESTKRVRIGKQSFVKTLILVNAIFYLSNNAMI